MNEGLGEHRKPTHLNKLYKILSQSYGESRYCGSCLYHSSILLDLIKQKLLIFDRAFFRWLMVDCIYNQTFTDLTPM